jgi:hypothetical protein
MIWRKMSPCDRCGHRWVWVAEVAVGWAWECPRCGGWDIAASLRVPPPRSG